MMLMLMTATVCLRVTLKMTGKGVAEAVEHLAGQK